MTSASAISNLPVRPVAFRLRRAELHWGLVALVALIVGPAMAAVWVASPLLGAKYVAISLLIVLALQAIRKDPYSYAAIALGVLPVLLLFRGLFFYNSLVFTLGGGLFLWFAVSPADFRALWRDRAWIWLCLLATVYSWLSFLKTGDYSVNIRVFELVLSTTTVILLGSRWSYLATAILGIAVSTTVFAVGLFPYGERLGMGLVGATQVGNPILLGISSLLLVLLSNTDHGERLLLNQKSWLRLLICISAGQWLILSGSRGSWISALVGLSLLLFLSRRDRPVLVIGILLLALVVGVWISSTRGDSVVRQFEKTVDSDRSLANRTSGRSEQWRVLPEVFAASPIWGWGPGSGREVAAIYTGRHLGWHSFYLIVVAETGIIGAFAAAALLGTLLVRAAKNFRMCREIAPLLGIVVFLAIGLTVSAMDALSGLFLGLGFMQPQNIQRLRMYIGRD